jgi:hypothetical protein
MSKTENQMAGGEHTTPHILIPNIEKTLKEAVDGVISRTGLGPESLKEQLFFDYFQNHGLPVDGQTTMDDMKKMDPDLYAELEQIYTDPVIDQFLSNFNPPNSSVN